MSYLDKIRQFEERPEVSTSETIIEPAGPITPVYWASADGSILGPGLVSHVARDGNQFFVCVDYGGSWRWINSDLLRSRQAFERQGQPTCHCCGGSDFWQSEHVAVICRRCHPPASPTLVHGAPDAGDGDTSEPLETGDR